jgi:hypothetical protein
MPPKPSWFHRIAEIREAVASASLAFLDRGDIEELFRVRRRQAVNLLHRLGASPLGTSLVVERARLLAFLDGNMTTDVFRNERRRREHVREALEVARREARGKDVRFPIASQALPGSLGDLSPEIRLAPGELQIRCTGAEDLLQKLYLLSKAIASDFASFERLIADK